MYITGKIQVTAKLPGSIKRLEELAYNLWWSWNPEAVKLFKKIDSDLWIKTGHNPIKLLKSISYDKVLNLSLNEEFLKLYNDVLNSFDNYMNNTNTWFNNHASRSRDINIAYFSAEYGLTEALPIYSGGLGVLSGDHCKSASDLGLPFTAVGLFYREGYFVQKINNDGWQQNNYSALRPEYAPVKPVLDPAGHRILVHIDFPGRTVYAMIWKVQVGRISLYLLDTDIDENNQSDRWLTARLYGGDNETRIQQEIILGIGGLRALEAVGVNPTICHMNEGHSSFMSLEMARRLIERNGLTFNEAKEVVNSSTVFTTHTPVPAGNDVFPADMIDKYFSHYWPKLGIDRESFLSLGFRTGDNYNFNMTVLALKMAGRKNGVSELHGAVSRNIFKDVWPGVPEDEVPISHITNGIHTLSWMATEIRELFDKYLDSDWKQNISKEDTWKKIKEIPDQELWKTHMVLKGKLIDHINKSMSTISPEDGISTVTGSNCCFDPNVLTIGFARRFATYKRPNLIFRDIERIKRILNKPGMPIQLVFAGKAHPADHPGQEVIKNVIDIARQEGFKDKITVLENYDINVAKYLVQGVDIWMNNPRRPLEASGTSGQKAAVNGVINFSILDGWWCEGYNGENGWAINDDIQFSNEYEQDDADSRSLCDILENIIAPNYYTRDAEGIPYLWTGKMKESLNTLCWKYSTNRMVIDYFEKMYNPGYLRFRSVSDNDFYLAKKTAEWKLKIHNHWNELKISADLDGCSLVPYTVSAGDSIKLRSYVYLGALNPQDVKVQVYYGINEGQEIGKYIVEDMQLESSSNDGWYNFTAILKIDQGGDYAYTFRVIPNTDNLINDFDIPLITWISC